MFLCHGVIYSELGSLSHMGALYLTFENRIFSNDTRALAVLLLSSNEYNSYHYICIRKLVYACLEGEYMFVGDAQLL